MNLIHTIPPELILMIVYHISNTDIKNFMFTCRYVKNIIYEQFNFVQCLDPFEKEKISKGYYQDYYSKILKLSQVKNILFRNDFDIECGELFNLIVLNSHVKISSLKLIFFESDEISDKI